MFESEPLEGYKPNPSTPLFSIGTVSRKVGVPAPTLRMWEERYGVVLPHRDDNNDRRLYTQKQIDELVWIREAIEEGLTAAEAHRMLETRRTSDGDTTSQPLSDRRSLFRRWVMTDHEWLDGLCAEAVERVPGVLLAYLGVHDFGDRERPGSWLLVSCLVPEPPDWFRGSDHRAARSYPDRLSRGELVSFPVGEAENVATEVAAPVMVGGEWLATVALVVSNWSGNPTESMLTRVTSRFEAWEAYWLFERLTGTGGSSATVHAL